MIIREAHKILTSLFQEEEIKCHYIRKPGDFGETLMGVKYDRLHCVFKTADYKSCPNPADNFLRPALVSMVAMIKERPYSRPLNMRKIKGERQWMEKDGIVLNVYEDQHRIMLEVLVG